MTGWPPLTIDVSPAADPDLCPGPGHPDGTLPGRIGHGMIILCPYLCSITSRSISRSVTHCGPSQAHVSWQPCLCAPARERTGWGHLRVYCNTCYGQVRQTTFYQPPHDITHHQARP
jgi:hypothetical protein